MNRPGPYFLLTLSAVFWGGTFVAGRLLGPYIDPYTAAFLRFSLASVLLLTWLYLRQRRFPIPSFRQGAAIILLACTGVLAYNLLFFSGLQRVEAGRAALIIAANPVLIALASALLFDERLTPQRATGAGLSVLGAIVVISRGDLPGMLREGIGSGEWMLLGCVVSWVTYTLIGKRLLNKLSPLVAVAYSSLLGTMMLGLPFVWRGGVDVAVFSEPVVWGGIAYLAVFGTVLAFVWFYAGVKAIGAARAAQFINLVPVSGLFFAAVLLDESVTLTLALGGLLVFAGLYLTNRSDGGLSKSPAA